VIKQIELNNFKCFEKLLLPLSNLTVLSGANASGKSSFLQALVLMHQTMSEHEWSRRLVLNGKTISLGTVADVVDKVNGRKSFEIRITDEVDFHWTFSGERDDMSLDIEQLKIEGITKDTSSLRYLLPPCEVESHNYNLAKHITGLSYLTAERVGPRDVYPLEDRAISKSVGSKGEHAVNLLYLHKHEDVLENLALKNTPPTLLKQVEAWMNIFFPGCSLIVEKVPRVNAATLGLRTSESTDYHRPANIGFGLTQVFPILVAALTSKKDDLLLIENPEVHLHPAGQALMGMFLSYIAHGGIQVIVETHSDHILNGIRRAVRSNKLLPEQLEIHFFSERNYAKAQVISPTVDKNGNLDMWPEGFFDQFEKDMNYFAGWGD